MRKLTVLLPLAASALALAACSESTDTAADETAATQDAATEEAAPATDAAVLDPNSASAEQLATVEGVSPELAQAIAAGAPYASVTDFHATLLETLSEDEAEAVLVRVFVPIDLNSASEEAILLIPGMTDKMVHEFEEYRPYADMGVFDREIGKYVDEAEVARLRQYVTL